MDNLYYKNEVTKGKSMILYVHTTCPIYNNPQIYVELDENIGDIHAMIADKEVEIIQELSRYVLEQTNQLSETVQVLSELDWWVESSAL